MVYMNFIIEGEGIIPDRISSGQAVYTAENRKFAFKIELHFGSAITVVLKQIDILLVT